MLSFLSRTTEEEPLSAESAMISVLLLQDFSAAFSAAVKSFFLAFEGSWDL